MHLSNYEKLENALADCSDKEMTREALLNELGQREIELLICQDENELEDVQNEIARMERELIQTKRIKASLNREIEKLNKLGGRERIGALKKELANVREAGKKLIIGWNKTIEAMAGIAENRSETNFFKSRELLKPLVKNAFIGGLILIDEGENGKLWNAEIEKLDNVVKKMRELNKRNRILTNELAGNEEDLFPSLYKLGNLSGKIKVDLRFGGLLLEENFLVKPEA